MTGFWEVFRAWQALVVARCNQCGQLVAIYGAADPHPGTWDTHQRSCTCQPTQRLPEGQELAQLLARARNRGRAVTRRI